MAATSMLCLLLAGCLVAVEGLQSAWRGCLRSIKVPPLLETFEVEADEAEDPGNDAKSEEDMRLDWAVTEAVQELHPIKLELPRVGVAAEGDTGFAVNRSMVASAKASSWRELEWHYGSHHKSGTNLLRYLAMEHINVMKEPYCLSMGKYGFSPEKCNVELAHKAKVWSWCNFTRRLIRRIESGADPGGLGEYQSQGRDGNRTRPPSGKFRGVHIIRDPIAMVASGYIYHMHNDDTPPPLRVIRNMSMKEALGLEAQFVLAYHGSEMVNTYTSAPSWVKHVRFEFFTRSSASFKQASSNVYQHMLGGIYTEGQRKELAERVIRHDLNRNKTDKIEGHVADPKFKEIVKKVINEIPALLLERLKEMRKSLGYADPG
eukprot:CAMPEP_0171198818 /NCGR_PEP_ID=MMETSP0790-20130122/23143_1 /TAXON_ID=2925 /ORGANISM="Alexandrium catenella, Strain OF101" /LENGTH=374 /DNA_ID=CAMNT_0011664143 /DNA_START=78 /DNA_END=1198 /DNA_ORIENTATION=-